MFDERREAARWIFISTSQVAKPRAHSRRTITKTYSSFGVLHTFISLVISFCTYRRAAGTLILDSRNTWRSHLRIVVCFLEDEGKGRIFDTGGKGREKEEVLYVSPVAAQPHTRAEDSAEKTCKALSLLL